MSETNLKEGEQQKDFQNIIQQLFNQANQEILKKKEKDRIYNEKIDDVKNIIQKLNELLKELDIIQTHFYLDINKENIQKKEDNIKTNIKILNLEEEIEITVLDIIINTIKQYEDIQISVSIKDKEIENKKKSWVTITQKLGTDEHLLTNIKKDKQLKMMLKNEKDNLVEEINNENTQRLVTTNYKEKKYYVEIATYKTEIKNIDTNINNVVGKEIHTKKFINDTRTGNKKFTDCGVKILKQPQDIQIDYDYDDTKNYVEHNQYSGRLIFNSEEEAKVWRCLTFDENRNVRPNSVYVVKNQELF